MKKRYYFILAIVIVGGIGAMIRNISKDMRAHAEGFAELTIPNSMDDNTLPGILVKELSLTKWNTADGLPYKKVPGANLGATSFEALGQNRIAFLCNSTSELIITDMSDGKAIKKFPVSFAPRDFVYDNGFLYVLTEYHVTVYDESGKEVNKFSFPSFYVGIERLARFNNATYLLLPSGNSVMIESGGSIISPVEYDGWITSSGIFVLTKLSGDNSYFIEIITANGKRYEKTLTTDKKVAGVHVVGSTKNRLVLDVQTFNSENPISVERTIISLNLKVNDIGSVIISIKVPDCYYVLSNKDFYVSPNGNIFNMLTSPQGAYIFSLTETESNNSKGYPESLSTMKYHFNDYLLEIEK